MHPMFNISLLKRFHGDPPTTPVVEEEPDLVDEADELITEQIVYHRARRSRDGHQRLQYLTKL